MKTTPRKRPQQARSKAMVEAILDATIRVLVRRGYESTTTIAIAKRAGVSVGSLYQYFPNKESLVAALVERHSAELIACIDAALQSSFGSDPRASIRILVRAALDAHRIAPALHKVLVEQVPRVGRIKVAMDTSTIIANKLADYLAPHRALLGGRDPARIAFVVETIVESLTHRMVLEQPDALSYAELESDVVDLVSGYLFAPVRDLQ